MSNIRISAIGLVGKSMFFDVPKFHAGGETILARRYHEEWGGKGFNQAVAAARQGAHVSFLGACAAADAPAIRAFCRCEEIDGFLRAKPEPTACASILTDGTGETRVTVFPGARLDAADVSGFAEAIEKSHALLLTNETPEAVNLAAAAIAKRAGVRIVLNPAPARTLPRELLAAASLFTPNEFEEAALFASAAGSPFAAEVVTTLGARGCRIRSTGEIVPATLADAVDSTGAGDTFSAVLAVRLAEGASLRDACVAANAAAAASVAVRYVIPSLPRRTL